MKSITKVCLVLLITVFTPLFVNAKNLDKFEMTMNTFSENDYITIDDLNITLDTDNMVYANTNSFYVKKYSLDGTLVDTLIKNSTPNYYHYGDTNCYTTSSSVTYACNIISYSDEYFRMKVEKGYYYKISFYAYSTVGDTIDENTKLLINGVEDLSYEYGGQSSTNTVYIISYILDINEYNINIDSNITNGSVLSSLTKAKKGDIVNITINPNEHFVLKENSLTINDEVISGTSFRMPNKDVTISAEFIDKLYSVTVEPTLNGTVTASSLSNKYGSTIELSILPNEGYEIDKIYVNNQEIKNKSFVLKGNSKVLVTFKESYSYEITNGLNQKYTGKDLIFIIDGNYNLFSKILINDLELDSKNYLVKEGSTIITLKKEYLDTLDNGTYSLKVLYSNDKVVSATFTIDNIKNPQTYDEINTYYYLSILSVVIICTSYLIKRKIKE